MALEARFADALATLIRSMAFREGRTAEAVRSLTELGAHELGVARASLWTVNGHADRLDCLDLYQAADGSHEAGAVIDRASAPEYFRALERRRILAAHDARNDPATCEFRDGYLIPLGITSMLDAPIVAGGVTVGVVCFEHVGPPRHFRSEERAFAASLADLATSVLEVRRRQDAEAELRLALDAARIGTFRVDPASGRVFWSHSTAPMYGLSPDAAPESVEAWIALARPDDRSVLAAALVGSDGAAGEGFAVQHRLADPALADRVLECRGRIESVADGAERALRGVVLDVTDQKRLEQQVAFAQRVEVMGRFAGAIAHDVNNVLTAIHGYAGRLAKRIADPTTREDVRGIEDAVDRAAKLTTQLLMFARRQPVKPGSVEVDPCIERLASMLEQLLGEDVRLERRLGAAGVWAGLEEAQLEQIVVNLVANARDAMPRGGTVTVDTHVVEHWTDGVTEPRRFVVVRVEDEGTGIEPAVLAHILEPFFTTKAAGAGTGLGLSTCQLIAAQAGGRIEVESELGRGSAFSVFLPTAVAHRATERPPTRANVRPQKARILLAEDDDVLRALAAHGISEAGHDVTQVASAGEGIALLEAGGHAFDLLVTDVVLTDGSGLDLAERFRRDHPSRPVIFVSGYAPRALARRGASIEEAEFLEKPFRPAALLARISQALANASSR